MKIRFATIGTGSIVDRFIRGAQNDPRFEYSATYSRNENSARAFASKYNVNRIFTDLQQLAAAEDIDAVYIASPNLLHCEQSIMMMSAGKHVICEKPLASSPEEVEKMIECAKKSGVAFMEAMKSTLSPNFKAIRENLPKIGRVRRYVASFSQYSSRMDNFVKGIEPVANVFNPEMKGGAKLDLGVYCIAPLVHLFGTPWGDNYTKESASKYIFTTDTMLSPGGYSESDREFDRKRAIDVQGSMIIQYPQMDALLSYSKAADSAIYCEIQGENGTLVIKKISTMDGPHLVMRAGVGDRGFVEGEAISIEDKEVKSISKDYDMYFEAREFMNLIENGLQQSTENSWDRSLEVVRICSIS